MQSACKDCQLHACHVPEVSLLFSYRSRTYLKPFTVSGMTSLGGKLPYPAVQHGQRHRGVL